MPDVVPSRDELCEQYLEQLPYDPYPVQEEALLAWFTAEQGVLVCAPTGMGKTLIAEAALFEALHTGAHAYYTTPLIALTEQKFNDLQEQAVRWGFSADDVGLVTGNRRVNPEARILVVVAEILLNRLLHPEGFEFDQVSAVVMDEFHSFADPERGIVWELTLGLLPSHVRLLLLSATVGNSREFMAWLKRSHQRELELVEGTERRVPLTFQWVPDKLLNEEITDMAQGEVDARLTPALIFCFNRDRCWEVAEQLKGRSLLAKGQQEQLVKELEQHDWSQGAGPKLRRLLCRGVGVHHAGMLPRYRRIVEELYQRKLLSVAVCTETLAAGINLPARSVVLPSLLKGPFGKQKVIDPSSAHQIFGRAGRPQFDTRGFVIVLAHEDDVKIARWKEKYDAIPDDTKDPGLRKAKKALKKKRPTRRETQQYWNEDQFEKLKKAPPGKLYSKGPIPWRLLAYLLKISPEVQRLRDFARKRLMTEPRIEKSLKHLDDMLIALWEGGFVELEPTPPAREPEEQQAPAQMLAEVTEPAKNEPAEESPPYRPEMAQPTDKLDQLMVFRSVHPVYGAFLIEQLGIADRNERIQALESVLEVPRNMRRTLKVPPLEELPPGPLAQERVDVELIRRGLATAEELSGEPPEDEEEPFYYEPPPLADKLRMLFEHEHPGVDDLRTNAIWAAGELLSFGGDFNKYVTSHNLVKQEGIVFRHFLRLILLCGEFSQLTPPEAAPEQWQGELKDISEQLTASCRSIDPESTDKMIEDAKAVEALERESFAD